MASSLRHTPSARPSPSHPSPLPAPEIRLQISQSPLLSGRSASNDIDALVALLAKPLPSLSFAPVPVQAKTKAALSASPTSLPPHGHRAPASLPRAPVPPRTRTRTRTRTLPPQPQTRIPPSPPPTRSPALQQSHDPVPPEPVSETDILALLIALEAADAALHADMCRLRASIREAREGVTTCRHERARRERERRETKRVDGDFWLQV
ncbi:hypothetical protein PUNSTDRAFT_131535 [Punctularia strigosozonata HHB-11173 SS5]|uniref:uncharacterized protein n=1 Tax=Punctularia strigosozonata (strain HHB-11173) TaxID=741275 RepID=UPI0004416E24|nr:uncharacterized protein PUNSTDRAFT_131535 [Punctularia strigosozonata HHB-11173 SS5]EIN11373.1 hypothetical protein PUNSTDRAFT_131535 [Punctularia strigosozonata HHB-11173 SS5]